MFFLNCEVRGNHLNFNKGYKNHKKIYFLNNYLLFTFSNKIFIVCQGFRYRVLFITISMR